MGEHKSIQTDRVILIPGPDEEVKIVRWIYQTFIDEGKSESEIAKSLNAQGVVTDFGRAWNRATVHQVLTNEKYIGNNVYHRTSFKLKRKHVENPQDKWIRADGMFEGIVEPEVFFNGAWNHSGAQPETYRRGNAGKIARRVEQARSISRHTD